MRYAVIDVGSNTIRTVVYDLYEDMTYQIISDEKDPIRLRQYLKDDYLTKDGFTKLVDSLAFFKNDILRKEVQDTFIFATQTVRQAKNIKEIQKVMEDLMEAKVDTLTTEQECMYGYQGMKAYLDNVNHGIYIDLGGGSTELVFFDQQQIKFSSFPFGSVVLRNMISSYNPNKEEIKDLKTFVYEFLESKPIIKDSNYPLIVTGEVGIILASLDLQIKNKIETIHGYRINREDVKYLFSYVRGLGFEELELIPGISKNRVDLLISTLYVFTWIMTYANSPYIQVTKTGLREGFLLEKVKNNGQVSR